MTTIVERMEKDEHQLDLIKWNRMDTAPRTGEWVLLDLEDGSTDSADYPMSCVYVGRWNPRSYPEIGPHFYQWEIINRYPDMRFENGQLTTNWVEGRVSGWLPMPALTKEP